MKGRVHSIQSLGAVDGPGIRCVVFLQGCPLRCVYCHNPDTWKPSGGREMEAEEVVKKVLRFRPYFGSSGGVTLTGGEPLLQADFSSELLARLRAEGIHTALDTSGIGELSGIEAVLDHTDLVLADLKFSTEEEYRRNCGGSIQSVQSFLRRTEERNIPLWIRHVVVPGLTDGRKSLEKIAQMARSYSNLQKIEWLPFHTMCLEKYRKLGIPFPLEHTPPMEQAVLQELTENL